MGTAGYRDGYVDVYVDVVRMFYCCLWEMKYSTSMQPGLVHVTTARLRIARAPFQAVWLNYLQD